MVMKARICIGRYSYRPDVDSGLRILGGSSWSVMEFHLRVPPEKWCITKAEFFAFVEEIRSLWESGRWKMTGMGLPTQAIHTALLPQPQGDSLSSFPMKSLIAGLKMFLF
jgi:hypothetical protein